MVCHTSCILSVAFITAMIFIIFNMDKNVLQKNFIQLLDHKQRVEYKKIINERRSIYIQGYVMGIIIAFIILYLLKSKNISLGNETKNKIKYWSQWSIICLTLTTVFIVNYFYYILYPKTNYMIEFLNNHEQIEAWLKIYKSMQFHYHAGFLIGLVAMIFITRAYLTW